MAKLYTANEIQKIVNDAYMLGYSECRNFQSRAPSPPHWSELVNHPIDENAPHRPGFLLAPRGSGIRSDLAHRSEE